MKVIIVFISFLFVQCPNPSVNAHASQLASTVTSTWLPMSALFLWCSNQMHIDIICCNSVWGSTSAYYHVLGINKTKINKKLFSFGFSLVSMASPYLYFVCCLILSLENHLVATIIGWYHLNVRNQMSVFFFLLQIYKYFFCMS
jgi:hypothetical protein